MGSLIFLGWYSVMWTAPKSKSLPVWLRFHCTVSELPFFVSYCYPCALYCFTLKFLALQPVFTHCFCSVLSYRDFIQMHMRPCGISAASLVPLFYICMDFVFPMLKAPKKLNRQP